jgi:hypothetical protein
MYCNKNKAKTRSLAFVNRIREAFGMKPLAKMTKGYCTDTHACALAEALVRLKGVIGTTVYGSEFRLRFKTDKKASEAIRTLNKLPKVTATLSESWDTEVTVIGPNYLNEFVNNFDRHNYPELIKKAA